MAVNPDENVNSGQSAAHSAAVATGNSPLDPQLQLLIEAWPTLSKAVMAAARAKGSGEKKPLAALV